MKMIEVLIKLANGEIKDGSILKIVDEYDELYRYEYYNPYRGFKNEVDDRIEDHFFLDKDFLNLEVELIPPKPKKYLVKLNIRGLKGHFRYLNYYKKNDSIEINSKRCTDSAKTHFTKDELQSIQPVREFLEDMEGKYELVEVEDNEID
ncbi:hypothetical protein CIRMBP1196_02242 [Enterococcus cecorum]|uniref:hypothetical protein n=1 Tax=Enterococcus cecorum TaxID=44008 RepID=UPI0022DCAE58|nr:hypothetical protein [Enterococcus cecorum]CAI3391007.1 hypothetical protein CIRMBP1296_00925 [Enterococcus cecorum]CAI3422361.1 hypothetical protein CIRMBP1274_01714 [Enterococcus cecorum]CAI3498240.1 hypothetical protein CIRMBP1196_02242 [Enterococcus cecorum]CAI3519458.1 hypothetical protein CIRMBP1288_01620 [Enterococcus cecorum]